jgi:hypothetical protein
MQCGLWTRKCNNKLIDDYDDMSTALTKYEIAVCF